MVCLQKCEAWLWELSLRWPLRLTRLLFDFVLPFLDGHRKGLTGTRLIVGVSSVSPTIKSGLNAQHLSVAIATPLLGVLYDRSRCTAEHSLEETVHFYLSRVFCSFTEMVTCVSDKYFLSIVLIIKL